MLRRFSGAFSYSKQHLHHRHQQALVACWKPRALARAPAPRGAAYLWRRGAGCSVGSVREYHGSGPCGPNEARRAGCRATAPLPVGSGAASVSESRTEAGSRCKAAALQRLLFGSSFQRCAHELRQLHPALRPHRFTDYSSGITASVPPSLHRSALQSEPTSSQQSQQMLKT